MEMGTIVSWAKKEGDKLNEGDLLAEIETDKATMGFETPEEGYLAKILVPAGVRDVPIGKLVCIIVDDESKVAAFKDYKDDGSAAPAAAAAPAPTPAPAAPKPAAAAPPPPSPAPQPVFTPSSVQSASHGSRIFASPLAKKLAAEKGLDLASIGQGSGLFGSITSKDLAKASVASAQTTIAAPARVAPAGSFSDLPTTGVRNVIAKRLLESKQTIPHYYLTVDISIDEIMKLRKQMNAALEKEGAKLTVNDFIIKATALACKKVPEANSAWMDTFIREFHTVDVSVAVSTKTGLITPIVFEAEKKGLLEISQEVKALANKAREGKLQPHEYQGGTISISNLGMFGIRTCSSIINPPQSCILAVGAPQTRLVPDSNSPTGSRPSDFLQVTLSCDHRTVDGAVGAQWLIAFRQLIEKPTNMLL